MPFHRPTAAAVTATAKHQVDQLFLFNCITEMKMVHLKKDEGRKPAEQRELSEIATDQIKSSRNRYT